MSETIVYITKEHLLAAAGPSYKDLLKDLVANGVINSVAEVLEVRFDKDKALHIQAVLAFFEAKDLASSKYVPDPDPNNNNKD